MRSPFAPTDERDFAITGAPSSIASRGAAPFAELEHAFDAGLLTKHDVHGELGTLPPASRQPLQSAP
jgi:hypothetical protein